MKIVKKVLTFIHILIVIFLTSILVFLGYNTYLYLNGEETKIYETLSPFLKLISKNIENLEENNIIEEDYSNANIVNSSSSNEIKDNKYRNLYKQLDKYAKIIYDKLYENKDNLKIGTYKIEYGDVFSELLLTEEGSEKLKKSYQSAIEALIYDNPEIFYLDVTKMYINIEQTTNFFSKKYNVFIDHAKEKSYLSETFNSKEIIEKRMEEIEKEKNKILGKIDGKNDYEKIKYIHDYLVENIEYDSSAQNVYNIYGAMITKKCVCEGYAKAFQYLLNEIGIENTIVIGTAMNSKNEQESHAWNYVKLDEKWYSVDVTWDDPKIIGGGSLTNSEKYKYFLKGSKTMNINHTPSGYFTKDGQNFTYPKLNEYDYVKSKK